MKLINLKHTLIVVLCLLATYSCRGEENTSLPPAVDLKLEKNSIALEESETVSVKIVSGNGSYKRATSPMGIASAFVKGNVINITALKIGSTTLTVTDAKDKSATIEVDVIVDVSRDADGKFSFAIYPDTQTEVYADNYSLFVDRSNWVVSQQDVLDIRGVLHIGDVVNWDDAPVREVWSPNDDHRQYEFAVLGLKPLRNAGIPTSLSIGNHDTMATGGGNGGSARDTRYTYQYQRMTESFNYYLNDAENIPTWKAYEDDKVDNGYWTFEAAGAKWLVLNIELWPRPGVVDWAKGVINANPDKNVVVQTHNMFNGSCNIDGAGQDSERWQYGDASPQRVWNQLVEPYSNVKVVTSGHTGNQCAKVFTTASGNKVLGTLQNNANGKDYNPVRILELDVKNGKATTWNYATRGNITRDMVELTGLSFIKE